MTWKASVKGIAYKLKHANFHYCLNVCNYTHGSVCVDLCTLQVAVCALWKCLHIDVSKDDVMQDIDSVDPIELSDAVLELKHWDVIHRHPEHLLSAQDLHLEAERKMQPG